MNETLAWSLILTTTAIVLVALELILPSAGLITAGAAVFALAGIVAMFMYDVGMGMGLLLAWCVLGPIAGWFLFKVWVKTPMGRALIGEPSAEEREQMDLAEEKAHERDSLIGLEGEVVTDLRPVGTIRVEGRRYDARTEINFIGSGERVRIVAVDAMEVRVRPIEG